MRILFISNYSKLYGANRSMLTIIEYLKNKGIEVSLILPEHGEIEGELKKKNIDYVVIKCFTQLYYYKCQFKYLSLPILVMLAYLQLPKLKKYACDFAPDLIYSNTSAENLGIKIAKSIGVKHISHIREFMDLDHGAKFLFGNRAKQRYINMSDGVIYVSKAVANHVNYGDDLSSWQKVIYNGVQAPKYKLRRKEHLDVINLGVVGILDQEKGQDVAISMMPKIIELFPNSLLHIWGDKEGAYKKNLLKMVRVRGLSNKVIFHGFEKSADIIYGGMDILLMCSRCEGFGRVTIEAMQRGIPVLGYNNGGTSELIMNGKNGFLFNNENECIGGLKNMMKSIDVFNQFRRNAFEYSRLNFSVEKYCANVEDFINMILSK